MLADMHRAGGLRYEEAELLEAPDVAAELPDLTAGETMAWDYELLGLSPEDHPLRLWRPVLAGRGVLSAAELARQPAGKLVKVAGLVIVRQAPPTANGHLFITLEDETGLVNLIVRPDLYERERDTLRHATLLLVEGRLQRDGAALSVLVQGATTLHMEQLGPAARPAAGAKEDLSQLGASRPASPPAVSP